MWGRGMSHPHGHEVLEKAAVPGLTSTPPLSSLLEQSLWLPPPQKPPNPLPTPHRPTPSPHLNLALAPRTLLGQACSDLVPSHDQLLTPSHLLPRDQPICF